MNNYSIARFFSNVARSVREITMPVWMRLLRKSLDRPLTGNERGVVVSLTSIPSRIDSLWVVIESMMRQKRVPDRIVVALKEDEFPAGVEQLPASLTAYASVGVEFLILPYNLRSHNKYFHTFRHCPEACIITIDDDCWYAPDTISRLVDLHGKYPDAVVANVARVIDRNHFYEYKAWKKSREISAPDHSNVSIGYGGVLYPPHFAGRCLDAGFDLFNAELIRELAPTADDLWLKSAEVVAGIKVACGGFFPAPVTVSASQKVSLRSINKGGENRNDIQWKALDAQFNLKQTI